MKGKKIRLYKRIVSIALVLFLVVGMPAEAKAADSVSYVDYTWNEETQTLTSEAKTVTDYTIVTETTNAMSNGWYVVNGEITVSERITVEGVVYLILADGAHLTASGGITVNEGKALYIYANSSDENTMGKLTATSTSSDAAIGSASGNYAGTIVINGGNISVTATAEGFGAGIGSGEYKSGYDIIINAGKVTATVASCGAAIGSGNCGATSTEGRLGEIRSISIHGGSVNATVTENGGAAIGGGSRFDGGDITITGGTVEATNSSMGAAIGGGGYGNGGNITITGGTIIANNKESSSQGGAGIGGGYQASGGKTIITGGTVTANGGWGASGIGGYKDAGTIIITGGTVTATGSVRASAIGGGVNDETGGSITVLSTTVTATKHTYGIHDIGAGEEAAPVSMMLLEDNTITVSGEHTLPVDYTIPEGVTLVIPEGESLTIPENVTLTKNGTIQNAGTIHCAKHQYHQGVCVICEEPCQHTGGAPTCITPATCTNCGMEYLDSEAHVGGVYSVNAAGDTIVDSCDTPCGNEAGTAQITATDSDYNGAPYVATVAKTGSLQGQSFDIIYCCEGGCTSVGEHTAKITLGNVEAKTTFSITKATPSVTITPGTELDYLGTEQCLIESATTTGGTIWYKLNDGEWSKDKPYATNADTYTVYYKVVGGDNFEDVSEQSFEVTIAPENVENYLDANIRIQLEYETIEYKGTEHTPEITLLTIGDVILSEGTDFTVAYSDNTNAGTAVVTITFIGNYSGTKTTTFEITRAVAVVASAPTANALTYDGAEQLLITAGTTNDGTLQYVLGVNDSEAPEDGWSEDIPTAVNAGTYYVWYKVKADENHLDSTAACLVVNIGKRLPAMTAPTPEDLTFNGEARNLISAGTTSAGVVLYSLDNENWSNVIPQATNAGIYTIYYKIEGTENYQDIAVDTFDVTIKAKSCEGFAVSLSQNSYEYNNTAIEPTVTVKDGETILIKGTDYEVNYEDNINAGTATVTVTFKGNYTGSQELNFTIVDNMIPTGSVSMKENSWNNIWNWLTFGLFFKDTVDVTVTADGTGSDVAQVEYLLSGEDLSNVSMPTEGWTTLTENDGKYSFSIQPQNKAAVYVRITDAANNVTIINSAGVVVYEDSVIAQLAIDYVYKENNDRVVTITANGNTFNKITDANGAEIDSAYYTVEGDKLTLKAEHLDTFNKGEYIYKVYMNPVGEETTEVTLEYTFKVNVTARPLNVTAAAATDREYDGTKDVVITGITLSGVVAGDDVGVSFSDLKGTLSGADVADYTSVVLGDLSQTVTLTGADKDNYKVVFTGGEVATDVSINKMVAVVTTAPVANNLSFNGGAQALVVAGVTADGTVVYSLSRDGEYSAAIPTGTNAGNYTVWYYVKGDANHLDSAKVSVQVVIKEGPYIENEEDKMGWDAILDEIEAVAESDTQDTVTIDMNAFTVVPGDVLEEIKGMDVTVEFDLGNGIVWSVNGAKITGDNIDDIDFAVTVSTEENPINVIPVEVLNKVTGKNHHIEISLAHDGEFGFTAVLSLNFKPENAGRLANLYYFDVTENALEFICEDEIAADGMAELTFTHASDYTIVITKKAVATVQPVRPTTPTTPKSPKTGDDMNGMLVAMLFVTGLGMLVVGQKKRVR